VQPEELLSGSAKSRIMNKQSEISVEEDGNLSLMDEVLEVIRQLNIYLQGWMGYFKLVETKDILSNSRGGFGVDFDVYNGSNGVDVDIEN